MPRIEATSSQCLSGQRFERVGHEAGEHDLVRRAGGNVEVLPVICGRGHLALHAVADGRVFEALDPFLQAAFLDPGRHRGVEARAGGGVVVHVRGDSQPLGAGCLDLLNQCVQLVPVGLARDFKVIDLGADPGLAGDADQLVCRFQQTAALAAEVRDVEAVVFGGHLAEGNQLVCLRVAGWGVNQGRGHAQRAFGHGLAHQLFHALQLIWRRRPVGVADLVDAHRGGTDERGDVAGDAPPDKVLQVFVERGPLDVILDVALLLLQLTFHGLGERPHGRAFAHDLERHALPDVALRTAILDERAVGPAQHVDETGGDRHPPRLQLRPAPRIGQRADGSNALPGDGEVAPKGRPAATVVDRAVPNDDVVLEGHRMGWLV